MDGNNNKFNGAVSRFYQKKSVFITGATGFMGKVLVHKLLVSCPLLETIYVLIRSKRGMGPQDRLQDLFSAPIFESIKDTSILDKVVVLTGDISLPQLGLSDSDIDTIVNQVSVIFHSAATVRFDEELSKSVAMNVEGTKSLLDLARKMPKLEAVIHVSTAYAHCYQSKIEEQLYASDKDLEADEIIEMCSRMPSEEMNSSSRTKSIIGLHPNTYTFTKAVAEGMLGKAFKDLPIAIVRPSIVVASWKDPFPGWVDNFNGPTGMVAGAATGVLRTMLVKRENVADIIPVDVAINVMIVAAWHMATQAPREMPIYNVTSGSSNPITWGDIEKWALKSIHEFPVDTALWYPGGSFKNFAVYDRLCRYAFHYAPAYLVDLVMTLLRKPRFLRKIVFKMTKAIEALQFFTTNQWRWTNHNLADLRSALVKVDPKSLATFDFDIKSLDWKAFMDHYVLGTRHYVLKNKPDTLHSSRKKMRILHLLHFIVQIAFAAFIYYLFMSF